MAEIEERIAKLERYLALPADPGELRVILTDIKKLSKDSELVESRKKLVAIVERFEDLPAYKTIVKDTKALTEELDAYLKQLRETEATSDVEDDGSSETEDADSVEESDQGNP